jgi:hypothetical protein
MKYRRIKISKWLLSVTMLLSVFAYSGYSNNPILLNNKKAQTELVCSTKTKPNKFTVAFKRTISASHRYIPLNYFLNHSISFLLSYNRLIKIRLDNISKLYRSIDQTDRFLQIKNISLNSNQDIFIPIG